MILLGVLKAWESHTDPWRGWSGCCSNSMLHSSCLTGFRCPGWKSAWDANSSRYIIILGIAGSLWSRGASGWPLSCVYSPCVWSFPNIHTCMDYTAGGLELTRFSWHVLIFTAPCNSQYVLLSRMFLVCKIIYDPTYSCPGKPRCCCKEESEKISCIRAVWHSHQGSLNPATVWRNPRERQKHQSMAGRYGLKSGLWHNLKHLW